MAERVVKTRLSVAYQEYVDGMGKAAKATRETGSEAEKLAQKREAFNTLGVAALGMGVAFTTMTALTVKAAIGWESAWAGVTKTVSGTPEELQAVEDGLRSLTGVLPASHDEIAAVAEAAGQLGIKTGSVVAFTRTMIDLGETTNLSANDAATSLARFVNIMGTSQDQVSNLGSAIVGLGNNYATTESEILDMSMRLAGAGRQVGLSEGEVLGLATALSSVGIEAEAGGSAVSKVMIDIAASVENGGDRLEMFASTAGMSADEFANKWKTAPAEALSAFVKGLSNAEAQGSSTLGVLADLGITEVRMRDALLRSASAADMFSGAMETGNTAFEENNALTAEAAKRYATVESRLAIAGNAVRDAAIDFGDVFLPAVAGASEAVVEFAGFMGGLPDPVQGVIAILGGLVGVTALAGGAALVAVPKIVQFRIAMETLGISVGRAALLGGGVVVALTALVTVVGAVAAAQAAARQRAEAYANTLSDGMNRITTATRDLAAENLSMRSQVLWWEDGSVFDAAERLGISLDLVTDAAMGNTDALSELDKQLKALKPTDAFQDSDEVEAYEANVRKLTDGVKGQSESIEEAIEIRRKLDSATKGTVQSSEDAAEAVSGLGDAAGSSSTEIQKAADSLREYSELAFGSRDAARAFEQSIDDMSDALEENGATLDINEQAGRDNQKALDDLAQSTLDLHDAVLQQTGSQDEANAVIARGRDEFVNAATAAGMAEDAAKALADQLGLVPTVVPVSVQMDGYESVYSRLMGIQGLLRSITGDNRIRVSTGQGGQGGLVVGNESGGFYDYQSARVKAFAGGGISSGIYPGGAEIHKFAEKSLPWEAYISPKPDKRAENYGVWMEAGSRLGFQQSPQSSSKDVNLTQHITTLETDPMAVAREAYQMQQFALRRA